MPYSSRNVFVVNTMTTYMEVNGHLSKQKAYRRMMEAYYEPDEFPKEAEKGAAAEAEGDSYS